MIEANKTIL